jgi:hypothetical protein
MLFGLSACNKQAQTTDQANEGKSDMEKKVEQYKSFKLQADISALDDNHKKMLSYLFEVAQIMDSVYWMESYGNRDSLNAKINDAATQQFVVINYGPWDRLDNNKSFVAGIGEKPAGANFYPVDMTKDEFENWENKDKESQYTMVRRDTAGKLVTIPYHEFFKPQMTRAADLLNKAAELAIDAGFKNYLQLRAQALLTDDYFKSDMAWMDMKDNKIDFVVGPIENYEDALYGFKAAHESFILIKDMEWTQRLAKYAAMLPELQKRLPVDEKYKKEKPGSNSDLGAYDVVFYAGDCNAGSKTIAINLPNDEKVQLSKGSRRLQLKNAMQAKFDNIMLPIANVLIAPDQRAHVKFQSFFENTMFHEVAHGLGIKNTIDGKSTVSKAMKEKYSALEEGKADILGLFMVTQLEDMKELNVDLMDNYVTFMAGIFRSIRFGASSAHGKANLIRFNYFKEKGAFTRNADGTYSIDFDKMQQAMNSLSELILTIQGNGDYQAAANLVAEKAVIDEQLQADLDRLNQANIPVDIIFEQGADVLGL